ncbi:MAG: hypothetical protein KIS67_09105 [Verrucomicrobiae bacterium]|nr:hypothetical protein [Verrucomicrobiae bacterium]
MACGLFAALIWAYARPSGFAAVDHSLKWESNDAPFQVSLFWYGEDRTLRDGIQIQRESIRSFSYGGLVTNIVFQTNLPSPASLASQAGGPRTPPTLTDSAPPRPFRPQYQLDNWTTQGGLPANKVNALLQTSDGYLWVGTVAGLARFDGLRFTVFDESNVPEMADTGSNIRALHEDEQKRLWIGARGGLLCRDEDRFVRFAGQESLIEKQILCFTPRTAGGFWFGAKEKVGVWDGQAIAWEAKFKLESEDRVLSLTEGPQDRLWVGCLSGLYCLDLNEGDVTGPIQRAGHRLGDHVSVAGLLVDRDKKLWVGTSDGGWWIESPTAQPKRILDADQNSFRFLALASFAETKDGIVWATRPSRSGLIRLVSEPGVTKATHLAEEIGDSLCITVDAEGALWIGTRHQGLFRLRPRVFSTLTFHPDIGWNSIRWVTEGPDGSIWFANDRAFIRWDGRNLRFSEVRNLQREQPPPINTAAVLPTGKMWAGFPLGGVFEPPLSENDPRLLLPIDPQFSEVGQVQVIHALRNGTVLLGTANGLYRVTENVPPERIEAFDHTDVLALQEDQENHLWVGTKGKGLIRLGVEGIRVFTRQDGLSHDDVRSLHLDADDQLWIGTESGLCLYRNGRCFAFEPASSVPQGPIHGILEDEFQRLWLAHGAGISRVARSELDQWLENRAAQPAVAHFDAQDGLVSLGISDGARPVAAKGRDGRLWFATRSGLSVVDPADCPTHIPAPQVFIESIVTGDKTLQPDEAARLPPGSGRHLDIHFTSPSLRAPQKVRLRYRLEGVDRGWRESSTSRRAVYANLGPGKYLFRVQACNSEGSWSERDATFAFSILPFFWQTGTFYGSAGGAVIATVAGLILWRTRRERRRSRVERVQALESERRRIARDMHDHLGAQLASVALASGENDAAHQRARETLRELNDLIWSVHPGNDTLPSLADFISNFGSRYLGTAGLKLDLDLSETIPAVPIASHLRQEVAAMFKEALRNITQHAQARHVTIRLRVDGSQLVLTVCDDGCGFELSALDPVPNRPASGGAHGPLPEHIGLSNFQLRSESLGGRCQIKSAPGQGTEVEIVVPLNHTK